MGSHAVALGVAYFAYFYTRRHARDARFSFGAGKVNALAGFTGAVLLAVFALMMAWESIDRVLHPVPIAFNQAIVVAFAGLIVNAVCAAILSAPDRRDHPSAESASLSTGGLEPHHDHNLRSAYLHVVADALTSGLAIFALLAGKYIGLWWLDPFMGLVGAALITRWSIGLARSTSKVLLDHQAEQEVVSAIRSDIEGNSRSSVTDIHVWSIGPGIYAAIVAIATSEPMSADYYRAMLPHELHLVHVSIEVNTVEPGQR